MIPHIFSPRFTDNRMTRCHHGLPFLCKKGSWPLTSLWSRWIHCHCIPSPTFLQPQQQQQIEFWDCPSKARWHLHAIVDDDAKSTNVPSTFTLLDALGDKSSKACTDQWIATFNHRHSKGHNSYSLESTKRSVSNHPLLKEGGWLNHIGSSVSLCARATRAILNHAPIGEFRKGFFPQSNHACPCSHRRVKTRAHILNDCSRFIYKNSDRMVIKHFVLFLTDSPGAFAWSSNIT